jgi:malonate decarboxylase beta subunit
MSADSFSGLTAAERAAALVDAGSLELCPAQGAARTTVVAARGRIGRRTIMLALADGHARGGTIGLAESRQLSGLVADAARRRCAVAVCWDSGGVRVQEGTAALAAAAAVGVAVTRLALSGVPVVHVISGPRGCFGAPAVIAGTGQRTVVVEGALWGLTGPRLLDGPAGEAEARVVMSAARRRDAGHADELVADRPASVRAAIERVVRQRPRPAPLLRLLDRSLARTGALLARGPRRPDAPPSGLRATGRQRDFFAYSFRRQWHPSGPTFRLGHVHAAWGALAGRPAMGIIVGPERSQRGIGVADAHAVLQAVRHAAATAPGAPIVTFLFCHGHASDLAEERAGLPRALAECLRGLTAARLDGHPLVCVLGGGAYGAAYLTLAAPSHRILAIRGTAVAPMAPRVLANFQRLRGMRAAPETPPALAELIPDLRIVESVLRLPRVLGEEIERARDAARRETGHP